MSERELRGGGLGVRMFVERLLRVIHLSQPNVLCTMKVLPVLLSNADSKGLQEVLNEYRHCVLMKRSARRLQ